MPWWQGPTNTDLIGNTCKKSGLVKLQKILPLDIAVLHLNEKS